MLLQACPHAVQAIILGTSSFFAFDNRADRESHCIWNHARPCHTSQHLTPAGVAGGMNMVQHADLTTLQAWFTTPKNDSCFFGCTSLCGSIRLAARVGRQFQRVDRRSSLSCGRWDMVSISIPKKVRQVFGPSLLCSGIEMPNLTHFSSRDDCQIVETGGPSTMKSSRRKWWSII